MSKETSTSKVLAPLTLLFFLWGFMTVLNDLLIPFLKNRFGLDFFQAMLVQTSFFGSYFLGSLIYFGLSSTFGDPINKIGYKNGIILGLVISGIGCISFYPAGLIDKYFPFLLGLMILGFGFTLLQIAANPFVSIAGPPETASSRLNLSQAFNSLGTTLGPLIGGYIIFSYLTGIKAISYPYLFAGLVFFLVALLFYFLPIPSWKNEEKIEKGLRALSFPNLRWGILAIFFYVGAEVGIGSLVINLLALEKFGGLGEELSSDYLSLYWGGLMIGRFGGSIIFDGGSKKIYGRIIGVMLFALCLVIGLNSLKGGIPIQEYLGFCLMAALSFLGFIFGQGKSRRMLIVFSGMIVTLLLLTFLLEGRYALWTLIGIGLFNSIMWPNIFTSAIEGLGKYTSQGSSLLVMAILGGAVMPPIMGWLADRFGIEFSLVLPIICYLYIVWYSSRPYWSKNTNKWMG